MSFTESLAEIIDQARKLESVDAKASYLRSKSSRPLQDILVLMCDKAWSFDLPDSEPPYVPSEHPEVHGALYRESRKFKYFVAQMPESQKVDQIKRESLFIQMLEAVSPEDAKLILRMVAKKPYPELSPEVVNEAFPGLINDPVEVKRGRGRPKKSEAPVS